MNGRVICQKTNHLNLQNNSADSFQPIQQKGLRLFMRRPLWHLQNTEKIRADRSEDKLLLSVGELRSYGALGNHMSTLLWNKDRSAASGFNQPESHYTSSIESIGTEGPCLCEWHSSMLKENPSFFSASGLVISSCCRSASTTTFSAHTHFRDHDRSATWRNALMI